MTKQNEYEMERIYEFYKMYRPKNFKDFWLITPEQRLEFSWFCKDQGAADFNCNISINESTELENKYRIEHNITPLIVPIHKRHPF